ncbi:hypothetical protein DFJ58DRAFT_658050, partial [Suillus subalutaceus]|uniref:uncharacterized protein n=1 Tax=Suillus subalutaceus TaxID=48586 RepID=UPI001B881CB5
ALMDFHYLIQSSRIDDHNIKCISQHWPNFMLTNIQSLLLGFIAERATRPIHNWYIPKIKLLQNIAPSICNTSVTMQWSADAMEHAHITEIKNPACSSNNHNYDSQICLLPLTM